MRPVRVTLTALGKSNPIILDTYRNPFSVGVNVVKTGDIVYSVEYTYDDVFASSYDPDAASSQWIAMSAFPNPTTTAKDGTISSPVMAVRLNVTSITGSATMTVIQAGMPGS